MRSYIPVVSCQSTASNSKYGGNYLQNRAGKLDRIKLNELSKLIATGPLRIKRI